MEKVRSMDCGSISDGWVVVQVNGFTEGKKFWDEKKWAFARVAQGKRGEEWRVRDWQAPKQGGRGLGKASR